MESHWVCLTTAAVIHRVHRPCPILYPRGPPIRRQEGCRQETGPFLDRGDLMRKVKMFSLVYLCFSTTCDSINIDIDISISNFVHSVQVSCLASILRSRETDELR